MLLSTRREGRDGMVGVRSGSTGQIFFGTTFNLEFLFNKPFLLDN